MADDDSRRDVASVGDAESAEQSINSGDTLKAESIVLSDDVPVASQPTEETPEDETTQVSAEDESATRDSDEIENSLALIQIEVEKPSAVVNVAASESTPKVKTEMEGLSKAKEAPAVTESVEYSKQEEKPEVQPETPKEEKLVPEASKYQTPKTEATESQPADEIETVAEEPKVEDTVLTVDNSNATKDIQVESHKEVETFVWATEEMQEDSHVEEEQPESSKDEEGEAVEKEEGEKEETDNEEEDFSESDDSDESTLDSSLTESEEEGGKDLQRQPLHVDEDRRNPQYIPKNGGFYEHDVRVEKAAAFLPVARGVANKRKSVSTERWGHDKFDPNQQAPKSTQELIATYGRDIRQEAGVPSCRNRFGLCRATVERGLENVTSSVKGAAYSRRRGRGGVSSRGVSGFERNHDSRPLTQRQEMAKKDEFPALSDGKQKPNVQGEIAPEQSSQSKLSGGKRGIGMTRGNERRGGGNSNNSSNSKENAVSYRRGGGGQTFEERREVREAKGLGAQSDSVPQSGEGDEEQYADQPTTENLRSPRRPTGGESSRGAPRGGSSRGTGIRGGALVHSEPPRNGASLQGRGVLSLRGRLDDNPNWNRGDEEGVNSRPGPPHQPFTRGPDASQDVCMDHRGRGKGKFGPWLDGTADQAVVGEGMAQMRVEDHCAPRNQDAASSKRYSSQRQRMTTPHLANAVVEPIQQPPRLVADERSAAYYASYNDSPPLNYASAAPAPLLPIAVTAQGALLTYIAQPIFPAGPGPAPFNAGSPQGYILARASPPVMVGVPIGSPTQDDMYGGGTMYYDPGRQQPIRHGNQPTRRDKAAIPIVAPDNEVDSWLISGRRLNQE